MRRGKSHWVHLYYPNNDHVAECSGCTGRHSANATAASFCPGNNHDFISSTTNGKKPGFGFSPRGVKGPVALRDGHPGDYRVASVAISGWSGSLTGPASWACLVIVRRAAGGDHRSLTHGPATAMPSRSRTAAAISKGSRA